MTTRRAKCGIALIEALMSVVIIGVGVVLIIQSLDVCVRATARMNETATAQRLLNEALVNFSVLTPLEINSTVSGAFDSPFEDYSWSASRQALPDTDISDLEVHVYWQGSRGERHLTARRVIP